LSKLESYLTIEGLRRAADENVAASFPDVERVWDRLDYFWQFGAYLSLASLAQLESAIGDYQAQHSVLVIGIAFLIYVSVTGIAQQTAKPEVSYYCVS
jgi:hypothetical protein